MTNSLERFLFLSPASQIQKNDRLIPLSTASSSPRTARHHPQHPRHLHIFPESEHTRSSESLQATHSCRIPAHPHTFRPPLPLARHDRLMKSLRCPRLLDPGEPGRSASPFSGHQ